MSAHSSRNMLTVVLAVMSGLTGCASGGGGGGSSSGGDLSVEGLMADARGIERGEDPRNSDNTRAARNYLDAAEDADTPAAARQQYQLALQSAQAEIAADPTNPLGHRLAALAYLGMDDFQGAGEAFDRAQQLRPIYEYEDVGVRENAYIEQYQLASPLLGSGDYEEAAEYLENADAIYHGRPEAKITLAQIYASLQEHDLALQKMDELDEFFASPSLADMDADLVANWRSQVEDFPLMRAQVLAAAGRYDEAVVIYRELVAEDPSDIDLRQDLAAILMQSGQTEPALQVYRDLADQPGLNSDGLSRIGLGLYQADQFAEAAVMLERAAEVSPMDRDAIEWWARALYADSVWSELPAVAERWVELDPNSGQGLAILAQSANQAGNTQVAQETVQRLQSLQFSIDNLQMRRNAGGGAEVSGSLSNRSLAQGTQVTLVFTFYAESGAALGNVVHTAALGAEGMSEVLQVRFDSAEMVGGYSYEVGG